MKSNLLLWIVQGSLAIIFLFAGGTKLYLPMDALVLPIRVPGLFIRFLGVAELLGSVGLVLPWSLGIRPVLTPIAAAGLTMIVTGATVITLIGDGITAALFPLVLALLSASVAYGRWSGRPKV